MVEMAEIHRMALDSTDWLNSSLLHWSNSSWPAHPPDVSINSFPMKNYAIKSTNWASIFWAPSKPGWLPNKVNLSSSITEPSMSRTCRGMAQTCSPEHILKSSKNWHLWKFSTHPDWIKGGASYSKLFCQETRVDSFAVDLEVMVKQESFVAVLQDKHNSMGVTQQFLQGKYWLSNSSMFLLRVRL